MLEAGGGGGNPPPILQELFVKDHACHSSSQRCFFRTEGDFFARTLLQLLGLSSLGFNTLMPNQMAGLSLPQADLISKTMTQGTKVYMTCAEKNCALESQNIIANKEFRIWNPYWYEDFSLKKIYKVSKLNFDHPHFLQHVARQLLNIE